MTDMWEGASEPLRAQAEQRRFAYALAQAEEHWPFLAAAQSEGEYAQRKAMAGGLNWEPGIHAEFDQRFAAQQVEKAVSEKVATKPTNPDYTMAVDLLKKHDFETAYDLYTADRPRSVVQWAYAVDDLGVKVAKTAGGYWVIKGKGGQHWGDWHQSKEQAEKKLEEIRQHYDRSSGMKNLMPSPHDFTVEQVEEGKTQKNSSLDWDESEWDENTLAAYLNGIEGVVEPPGAHGTPTNPSTNWYWYVKPTGQRSEWPEIDSSGSAATEAQAKADCEAAMRRADASYGHPFKESSKTAVEDQNAYEQGYHDGYYDGTRGGRGAFNLQNTGRGSETDYAAGYYAGFDAAVSTEDNMLPVLGAVTDQPPPSKATYPHGGPYSCEVCGNYRDSRACEYCASDAETKGIRGPSIIDWLMHGLLPSGSTASLASLPSEQDLLDAEAALDYAGGDLDKAAAFFGDDLLHRRKRAPEEGARIPGLHEKERSKVLERGDVLRQRHQQEREEESASRKRREEYFDAHPSERGSYERLGSRLAAEDNLYGDADRPDLAPETKMPVTTRPRVTPELPRQTEFSNPAPPEVIDPNTPYQQPPTAPVDRALPYSTPTFAQAVAAKVAKIASTVAEDNPHLSTEETRRIAMQALSAYPEIVRQ